MTGDDGAPCWCPGECDGSPHAPPRSTRFVDDEGTAWLVRPFEPGDREPLLATYRDFAPEERAMHLPPADDDRCERWLGELLEEGRNVVAVRERDGPARDGDPAQDDDTAQNGHDARDREVVGHAVYTPADAAEPELAVFVHQGYQGRGLGTELCRHVVAGAAAADRDALVLDVEPSNRAAIHVYERLGFERVEDAGGLQRGPFRMRLELPADSQEDAGQTPAVAD